MIASIRSRLSAKLFLSYLIVILVGVAALATAAELTIPNSFNRHMVAMGQMMGGMGVGSDMDLFTGFRSAVNESLAVAAAAAIVVAAIASVFLSRRVVAPVREIMTATARIADGRYSERVKVPGHLDPDQMDELARLAVSFNQMASKLEQTETMRRELIGDVAHELRTPLATIQGSMEGLLDGVVQPTPEAFHRVAREADRLQRLVADLQELSRVEAGAFQLDLTALTVQDLVGTVISRLQRQFDDKGITLIAEIQDPTATVVVDEHRMGQVLLNLVGNALQFTPRGGSVRIVGRVVGGSVQIQVKDTGIGIPADRLPHVFARFYRVDRSRARSGGGSGVGLTIAKHWVEAHGGSVRAESPGLNLGSTFTVELPIAV